MYLNARAGVGWLLSFGLSSAWRGAVCRGPYLCATSGLIVRHPSERGSWARLDPSGRKTDMHHANRTPARLSTALFFSTIAASAALAIGCGAAPGGDEEAVASS